MQTGRTGSLVSRMALRSSSWARFVPPGCESMLFLAQPSSTVRSPPSDAPSPCLKSASAFRMGKSRAITSSMARGKGGEGLGDAGAVTTDDKYIFDEKGKILPSVNAEEAGLDVSKYSHEVEVRMPDMGEGEGEVIAWYKNEGDIISRGDALCDIKTPDFEFTMDIDDENDAVMGKILVPANSGTVGDGAVICTMFHEPEK